MILAWMVAAIVFALLVGIAARATDAAFRRMQWQGRAPWVVALTLSLLWPVVVPWMARPQAIKRAPIVVRNDAVRAVVTRLPPPTQIVLSNSNTNTIVLSLWAVISILLAARLLAAHRAVTRISRNARRSEMDGHEVWITDGVGPAVVGITAPRIAIPAWLSELDAPLRELVLRHENEHCRARDTIFLALAEVGVVMMPWNPAVWWQARSLRLALELDCDTRTLRNPEAATTYGSLLLLIAQRQQMTRLAPMLAESSSHLSRRIIAMNRRSNAKQPFLAAAFGAAALIAVVAACTTGVGADLMGVRSNPVAARITPQDERSASPALAMPGSPFPRYPDILKMAGVEGEAIVTFVVDTTGVAVPGSERVVKATHQLFANSVLNALPKMRFRVNAVDGRNVQQLVQLPVVFNIFNSGTPSPTTERMRSTGMVLVTGLPSTKQR